MNIDRNKEIESNSLENLGLENIVNSMSGVIYWQNLDYVICGVNDAAVKLLGHMSVQAMVGTTVFDFRCKAVENAPKYFALDEKVTQTNHIISSIIVDTFAEGVDDVHLVKKSPIINNNQIVGVLTHGHSMTQTKCLTDIGVNLYRQDIKKHNRTGIYTIEDNIDNFKLSAKEMECLFYLIRGKTMREIAHLLYLSPRTIEFHIEKIKEKLGCRCKSELIEKAIATGYMAKIPKRLLTKRIVLIL